ncbi:RNA polymerase sigma factor SigF [Streptomyces sp. RPA4-5]|uniref:RNA polymerase sigma factor SigF n=1 Tax=Streptomyces TaxID=1883 RepID=UPI00143EF378|nr:MULTISPECIES: RNA polymerase sigma factor SigF [Streptomyces]MCX4637123.1 RNA polymerase sigma factor SigF [Streptomyces platensis]QIY54116.1 RNA polymerase sigma factor SigF [Streptomyces sp. RPA4-5]WJY36701.1 RNA polymerase sigma factor SigF [Streptomyces sp. P9-2B-2]
MRTAPAASPEDLPHIEDPQNIAPRDARELTQVFFRRLETLEEGTHAYQYARNTLIEMNLSLVRYAARRFRNRGDDMDDILQVGTIGLIKAIDRYDVSRDVEFTTLAIPYITGEMRRFFRDTTWDVRVPRRLQELRVDLARANEKLSGRLGRDPKVSELAAELGISEDEVVEGQVAANGYNASSIDATFNDDGNDTPLADLIGERDPEMDLVEDLHALAPLLNQLEERDRHLLEMRFGQEMTQAQIGKELGVSQMHISRLLTRALTQLRAGLLNEE